LRARDSHEDSRFQRIETLLRSRYAADGFRYAADGYSTHGYSTGRSLRSRYAADGFRYAADGYSTHGYSTGGVSEYSAK
jgi:hypothetical protein